MTKFKDIGIINVEEKMTFQALHEPNMHYCHLKLSAVPLPWRNGPLHGSLRGAT